MAAKIIPFPQFLDRQMSPDRVHAAESSVYQSNAGLTEGLHLVGTAAQETNYFSAAVQRESQQDALRIVQEVQQEWTERRQSSGRIPVQRTPEFWATLPVPQPGRETPLTVARRLMHMLFPPAKIA